MVSNELPLEANSLESDEPRAIRRTYTSVDYTKSLGYKRKKNILTKLIESNAFFYSKRLKFFQLEFFCSYLNWDIQNHVFDTRYAKTIQKTVELKFVLPSGEWNCWIDANHHWTLHRRGESGGWAMFLCVCALFCFSKNYKVFAWVFFFLWSWTWCVWHDPVPCLFADENVSISPSCWKHPIETIQCIRCN